MTQQATELIATQMAASAQIQKIWNFLFNVKAAPYNAKGNGSDDTGAIQKTINAAIAANSKSVFFPSGTYSATALTGLDQVVVFGDNATLTVGGVPINVEQLGTGASSALESVKDAALYSKALSEMLIVPAGSLDRAKNAIATTKTLKVVEVGDSITEGLDQTSPEDAYTKRVERALTSALPGITTTVYNYGLGGTGIGTLNDPTFVGGTNFTRPWSVNGKTWLNHVRDAKPDLVIVAFGMNDAGIGPELNYNGYTTLLNTFKTWDPVPSVILVPSMLPTKDTKRYNQGQNATNSVARSTRQFAKDNGLVCADANRLFQLLRDGIDDVSRVSSQELNFSGFPSKWTGSVGNFSLSGSTLNPSPGLTGRFVTRPRDFYNGALEFDVNIPGSGINNSAWINYRDDTTNGRMTVLIMAGSGSTGIVELYTNDSTSGLGNATGLTIQPGVTTHIRIEALDTNHKIYVNGALALNITTTKKLHNGYITIGGTGLVPTYSNMQMTYLDPLKSTPIYTEDDLLGKYPKSGSGNGINHPSGLGHAIVYAPTFNGMIRELTLTRENGLFLPIRLPKTNWGPPSAGGGYPLTTTAGETLYYQLVSTYDKYRGIRLRRQDNGAYYTLSSVALDTSTLANLEPGKFAYYPASPTQDFMWISVPGGGGVNWEVDEYKYQ